MDFESNNIAKKVHLFSNILDIDYFSMSKLINTILKNFSEENIFICASPYVSSYKTERLDNFMQSFSQASKFKIISEISQRKGEWDDTNWSRVIRVFKCDI